MLGEAFSAIAALEKEGLAGGNLRQSAFEVACLTCKNQWRKARKLCLDFGQRLGVRVFGHLHDRLVPPGIRAPLPGICERRHRYLQASSCRPPQRRMPESIVTSREYGFRARGLSARAPE